MENFALDEVGALRKQVRKTCKDAQQKVEEKTEACRRVNQMYPFEDEEYLRQDAKLDMEKAKARLEALVEMKIAVEIVYRKLKNRAEESPET